MTGGVGEGRGRGGMGTTKSERGKPYLKHETKQTMGTDPKLFVDLENHETKQTVGADPKSTIEL